MIGFNVAPFTGKEFDYIKKAIENEKICGDGDNIVNFRILNMSAL